MLEVAQADLFSNVKTYSGALQNSQPCEISEVTSSEDG